MYQITEILPNGCLMLRDGDKGVPYIETGDFDEVEKLLSDADIAKVKALWTPDLIAKRELQITEQKKLQAFMLGIEPQ